MSAGRALSRRRSAVPFRRLTGALRRRHAAPAGAEDPPVYWGRVGAYEGVSRRGMLFLLSPDAAHPSVRSKSWVGVIARRGVSR